MKKIICLLIGIIPFVSILGCNSENARESKAEKPSEAKAAAKNNTGLDPVQAKNGNFANVISFDSYADLQKFTSDNGVKDVYACSDGVGEMKLFLVVPSSDDIKLELYHSVTDKYGNVEPNYDCSLCDSKVGQPIYFAAMPKNGKVSLVVVAVNAIGKRASWSPEFDENGKLGISEDFSFCYPSVLKKDKNRSEISKTLEYSDLGIKFFIKDGRAFLNVYDVDKYIKNRYGAPLSYNIENGTYEISNLEGPCKDLFIGDIGQDTNPILCFLLFDGTVEIMSVRKSIDNGILLSSGRLKGLWDVDSFVNAGGGPYENEGQTMYSYTTIYGIDSGKHRTEVELFYLGNERPYVASDNQKILLLEDFTLAYFNNGSKYKGRFNSKVISEENSIFEISYKFVKMENSNGTESDTDIRGVLRANMSEYGKIEVTPISGFDFGVGYENQIIFNAPSQR